MDVAHSAQDRGSVSTQTSALTSREPSPAPFQRSQPGFIQRHRLKLMIPTAGLIGAGVGYGLNRWLTHDQPPKKQLSKHVRAIRQW